MVEGTVPGWGDVVVRGRGREGRGRIVEGTVPGWGRGGERRGGDVPGGWRGGERRGGETAGRGMREIEGMMGSMSGCDDVHLCGCEVKKKSKLEVTHL